MRKTLQVSACVFLFLLLNFQAGLTATKIVCFKGPNNCLYATSVRVFPSGMKAVEAYITDSGAMPVTTDADGNLVYGNSSQVMTLRWDSQIDCRNGTIMKWNENAHHPPRLKTFNDFLYKYTCAYGTKKK